MSVLAFLLLILALLLFLLSTRQWALPIRGAVWGGGLVALIAAMFLSSQSNHGGLFGAFGDFIAHFDRPGESILVQALGRNLTQVGRFVLPLLDLFLILAALLALLTVVAFTPGETLENIARPIAIGLVGAIAGGMLALVIVGTGFGDVAEQAVYSTNARAEDVYDGDTLWVGEVSVRLAGIDAPEITQICRNQGGQTQCGEEARRHLQSLVNGALLTCERVSQGGRRTNEPFARPLVRCTATRGRENVDVASEMAADGYAIATEDGARAYQGLARVALDEQRGVMSMCTLRPDVWRSDSAATRAFTERGTLPRDATLVIGHCPLPSRPTSQQRPNAPYAP